jgi:hypothetical protein
MIRAVGRRGLSKAISVSVTADITLGSIPGVRWRAALLGGYFFKR